MALKKLRVRPNYYEGRRGFCWFLLYLMLLFWWWSTIADIEHGRGVEMGLQSRISAIQFEVTPGPHFSQSIRATNWEGVRNIADLHDLTLAMVENLYSDDDSTYATPEDRVALKANTLKHVYRNTQLSALWEAVSIDTDPSNIRQNCTNWVIADPAVGGFDGKCEFFERCTGETLEEMRRIVAVGGTADTAVFTAREVTCQNQKCEAGYALVRKACDGDIGGLTNCANPGCKTRLKLAGLMSPECSTWMADALADARFSSTTVGATASVIEACLAVSIATDQECAAIDTADRSGLELKNACEARSGCKYWTELWKEQCVSDARHKSWLVHGSSSKTYNGGGNMGLTNLYNHPLPWLAIKMNRRTLSGCARPAECPAADCPVGKTCPCPFAGYTAGDEVTPSTTCPAGCDLSWATVGVAATCTGTATGADAGKICDLNAATNSTAACPLGCASSPAIPAASETCLQSTTPSEQCLVARSSGADCTYGGIFAEGQNVVDKSPFIGAETGFVYKYDEDAKAFPFYVRLDDDGPEVWLGLLELLRADRWLSYNTVDFTVESLVFNRNTETLGRWSITWKIDTAGLVRKPEGFVVHSFPLSIADPGRRSASNTLLLWLVFLCLLVDAVFQLRIALMKLHLIGEGEKLQMKAVTAPVPDSQIAVFAMVNLVLLIYTITGSFALLFEVSNLDPAKIEPMLLGYEFTGMASAGSGCDGLDAELQPACEMDSKIQLMNAVSEVLEKWALYRNMFGVYCLYTSVRMLGMIHWAKNLTVLWTTLQTAARQLFYFACVVGVSGCVFTLVVYLNFGRRFLEFRNMQNSMFALMAPMLGGDSSLEAAVIESSRAGDNGSAVLIYVRTLK